MKIYMTLVIFIATTLSGKTYTLYINSNYNDSVSMQRWNPTIDYLNEKIPNHKFKLLPIKPTEVERIKALLNDKKIDFIITQPAIYSELKYTNKINRVLTMTNEFGMNKFGSVIITYKNSGIENILDIEDKNIAAVAPLGFGGWLIAYKEMYDIGIDPLKDNKVYFTGSQEKVVNLILNKKYDVGVIRTGVLEKIAKSKNIDISDMKIINEKHSDYPVKVSTKLYPEWTFAIAEHIKDDKLKSDVFKAMNSIAQDSNAAIIGKYQDWSLPQNYSDVDELLKIFKLAHYKDIKQYSINDIIEIAIYIFILFVIMVIYMKFKLSVKMQRQLKEEVSAKTFEIKGINENLAQRVNDEIEKNRVKELHIQQQSKLAQMGEMISMIAHQWRQPLAAMASTSMNIRAVSLLNKFDLSKKEEAQKYEAYVNNRLDNLDGFIQNLTRTIDDFRYFYKPNKTSVKVQLEEVFEKSFNIIKDSLKNNSIKVITEYNSKEEIELYDGEMMQVILNLLKNAQDNLIEKKIGNPRITITTENRTISICDNGGGIPEDIMENIFEPYFSTKDEKNGTGLGLYMSKIIVEDHHKGKIQVQNTEDGVCFIIELGAVS